MARRARWHAGPGGQSTVLSSGKTSTEVAHYIGSGASPRAARVVALVRCHWGIEKGPGAGGDRGGLGSPVPGWRDTTKVGCAREVRAGLHCGYTVGCDYAPGSNLSGPAPD